MVRLDEEMATPQVWPSVTNNVDQADELTLIYSEVAVAGGHNPTEEGDRMSVLNEHRPESMWWGITLDNERLGEVWHGEDGTSGDRGLKRVKSHGGLLTLGEALLFKQHG
jgi:hypothetical protein